MWFKQLSLFRLNPDALPDLAVYRRVGEEVLPIKRKQRS